MNTTKKMDIIKSSVIKMIKDLEAVRNDDNVQDAYRRLDTLPTQYKDMNLNYELAFALCTALTAQHIEDRSLMVSDIRGALFDNEDSDSIYRLTEEFAHLATHPDLTYVHTKDAFDPLTKQDLIKTINKAERYLVRDYRKRLAKIAKHQKIQSR